MIKQKTGICSDCGDGKTKPITAGRCQFHYKKYRAEVNAWKKEKREQMNDFIQSYKKPKPIPKVSKKQIERYKEYRIVRDEFMKLHPTCQARLSGCTVKATDLHHSRGKIGDLLTDKRHFKALCRSCHRFIEENPKFSKENGYSENRI